MCKAPDPINGRCQYMLWQYLFGLTCIKTSGDPPSLIFVTTNLGLGQNMTDERD